MRCAGGGAMAVKLPGRQLALFVDAEGAVRGCSNRCPHERYTLAKGALDARFVQGVCKGRTECCPQSL